MTPPLTRNDPISVRVVVNIDPPTWKSRQVAHLLMTDMADTTKDLPPAEEWEGATQHFRDNEELFKAGRSASLLGCPPLHPKHACHVITCPPRQPPRTNEHTRHVTTPPPRHPPHARNFVYRTQLRHPLHALQVEPS